MTFVRGGVKTDRIFFPPLGPNFTNATAMAHVEWVELPPNMRCKPVFPLLALISAPIAASAAATVTTLQYPGAPETYATGVNTAGAVVGTYFDGSGTAHGFLYVSGQYTAIDIPGAAGTWITGINDSNGIVGYLSNPIGDISAFMVSTGGSTGRKLSLFSVTTSRDTAALGLDSAGEAVGYSVSSGTGKPISGFTYQNSAFTTLDISGQTDTWVTGISQGGTYVVGYAGASLTLPAPVEAFISTSGGTPLTVNAPAAAQTFFNGVNDKGVAVGYYVTAAATAAGFIYKSGFFLSFTISGASSAIPSDINDNDVIVGSYTQTANPNVVYGFISAP
jgi:probable HAF family extracellular repeat protein